MAYGPSVAEIFRKSGEYTAKILHGAKPSVLPIQRPEKFDLVINLKTAAALGINSAASPTRHRGRGDRINRGEVAYC